LNLSTTSNCENALITTGATNANIVSQPLLDGNLMIESLAKTICKENANQISLSVQNGNNVSLNENNNSRFEYIPAPKWNKVQNSMLEEMFKKSRYPKPSELKSFAQKLHVMDSDIEEWFRKRRGRDRKTRRKNEALKSLIDNYLDK
jgi:hypothetical protein